MKPISKNEPNDLVTVACFGNAPEAHLARTLLESKKIQAYIADEQIISMFPMRDIGWGGVKVKTSQSDAQLAMRILNRTRVRSFWVPHPLATLVYMFPEIVGIPLIILLTPFALFLNLIWKYVILKFIYGVLDIRMPLD